MFQTNALFHLVNTYAQQRQALAKVYAMLVRLAEQSETASPVEPLTGSTGKTGNSAFSNQKNAP